VRIGEVIFQSPAARTAIPVALALMVGLFSNFLVTEMTVSGTIMWASFYQHVSFYVLMASTWLTYRFHKKLHEHETEVERFKDADYCTAFARSQLLPSHLEEAKAAIKRGDTKRFEDAMAQVKKTLK
jgi:hypothetical protein